MARALADVLQRLQLPDGYDVVDVGAGDGRLLVDLHGALPPDVAARGNFVAVELTQRPAALPAAIGWCPSPPATVDGLLIAHEYLDTVPCEIAELDADGAARIILADGVTLGPKLDQWETAWLERWWPLTTVGQRADVGRTREDAWHELTARLTGGLAIAMDYGHMRAARPAGSTLAGWARGRPVSPVPDSDRDLTAHVAMDACAQPGDLLLTQRAALTRFAADPEASPAVEPRDRLRALAEATHRRTLLDPDGFGSYLWLVHAATDVGADALFRRENAS